MVCGAEQRINWLGTGRRLRTTFTFSRSPVDAFRRTSSRCTLVLLGADDVVRVSVSVCRTAALLLPTPRVRTALHRLNSAAATPRGTRAPCGGLAPYWAPALFLHHRGYLLSLSRLPAYHPATPYPMPLRAGYRSAALLGRGHGRRVNYGTADLISTTRCCNRLPVGSSSCPSTALPAYPHTHCPFLLHIPFVSTRFFPLRRNSTAPTAGTCCAPLPCAPAAAHAELARCTTHRGTAHASSPAGGWHAAAAGA